MSIVALKRKANAKYSSHSSKSPLGFSLNGTVRNHQGRIGQTSMMSRTGGPKSRNANYSPEGLQKHCCHDNNNAINNSVGNTRGMLANKYRWKKHVGDVVPYGEKNIFNQWVQPDSNHGEDGKGDQGNYIQNVKTHAMACNKSTSYNGVNPETGKPHIDNCRTTVCSRRNGGTRIGGKLIPKAIYTKKIGDYTVNHGPNSNLSEMHGSRTGGVVSSGEHNSSVKFNKSNLFSRVSQKPFPFRVGANRNCAVNYETYDEAQDSSYYTASSITRPGC